MAIPRTYLDMCAGATPLMDNGEAEEDDIYASSDGSDQEEDDLSGVGAWSDEPPPSDPVPAGTFLCYCLLHVVRS